MQISSFQANFAVHLCRLPSLHSTESEDITAHNQLGCYSLLYIFEMSQLFIQLFCQWLQSQSIKSLITRSHFTTKSLVWMPTEQSIFSLNCKSHSSFSAISQPFLLVIIKWPTNHHCPILCSVGKFSLCKEVVSWFVFGSGIRCEREGVVRILYPVLFNVLLGAKTIEHTIYHSRWLTSVLML